ncbi:MAG: CTAG/PCC1 family protein [Candidatus Micrarchaeales archaeon]|nr:CTAG/PCC1 family protein [Candidatus Micrarchaeales archaeon]
MKAYSVKIVMPKKASIDYRTALGEIKEHERSGVSVKETEKELVIEIETSDATALRSSVNAVLRDIQTIEGALSAK